MALAPRVGEVGMEEFCQAGDYNLFCGLSFLHATSEKGTFQQEFIELRSQGILRFPLGLKV